MAKHGKQYLDATKQFDRDTIYSVEDAITLCKEMAYANFDESVEVHFRLGIDPRQADQQLRGTILMPAGLGKSVRVAVFAEGEAATIAEEAGAELVLDEQAIQEIQQSGNIDFDTAIAVPEMMSKVGRLGRLLGPRGLMPNPKSGTVVQADDLPRVIEEAHAGRIEYRNDKTGNLHVIVGKVSFSEEQLLTNMRALMEEMRRARPAASKGQFIRRMVVCSTMGPGIKVDPNQAFAVDF
jgi:large subunit ribosomal protein L1